MIREARKEDLDALLKLWNIQSRVIEELAGKGSFVIVGRCADYILREKADCLTSSFTRRQGDLIELISSDALFRMIQKSANRYYDLMQQ